MVALTSTAGGGEEKKGVLHALAYSSKFQGHYDSFTELRRYFNLEWISGKSRFKTCTGSLILI